LTCFSKEVLKKTDIGNQGFALSWFYLTGDWPMIGSV